MYALCFHPHGHAYPPPPCHCITVYALYCVVTPVIPSSILSLLYQFYSAGSTYCIPHLPTTYLPFNGWFGSFWFHSILLLFYYCHSCILHGPYYYWFLPLYPTTTTHTCPFALAAYTTSPSTPPFAGSRILPLLPCGAWLVVVRCTLRWLPYLPQRCYCYAYFGLCRLVLLAFPFYLHTHGCSLLPTELPPRHHDCGSIPSHRILRALPLPLLFTFFAFVPRVPLCRAVGRT